MSRTYLLTYKSMALQGKSLETLPAKIQLYSSYFQSWLLGQLKWNRVYTSTGCFPQISPHPCRFLGVLHCCISYAASYCTRRTKGLLDASWWIFCTRYTNIPFSFLEVLFCSSNERMTRFFWGGLFIHCVGRHLLKNDWNTGNLIG